MENYLTLSFWKTAPFIRLLFPLIAGILLQYYLQLQVDLITMCISCFSIAWLLLFYLPLSWRFRTRYFQGLLLQLSIASFALFLTWKKDVRHQAGWYGNIYEAGMPLVATLSEPPVDRIKSIKAEAVIEKVMANGELHHVKGKIILYFSKKETAATLHYGDRILMITPLQLVKNSGNPGAFDYKRYASFQQLFHTAFVKPDEFVLLKQNKKNVIDEILFATRDYIISVMRKYLPSDKNITGIAEALLIGYKEDLDKDLVQSYSSTGVVHIIAISGLHLGLIYVLLVWLMNKIPFIKKQVFLKVVLILGFLWFFSLLTGASASVLRSAVMFTCVVIGKNYFRQASVYNSLAASAFLLLCFDPYFLWDVGFQLSYLAIYGIVWLQRPLYHSWHIRNKWLNKIWEMASVTIAAQIITFPICIFYFHQFPNLFLITNLLTVPLSTIILFAEILLIVFSWYSPVAMIIGKITGWMIAVMNWIIEKCSTLPYALTDHIYSTALSTFLLYGIILGIWAWIIYKQKGMLRIAIANTLFITLFYVHAFILRQHQFKIIIYNISQRPAIDFIYKKNYFFKGDSVLSEKGILQNYNLTPSRIQLQAYETDSIPGLTHAGNFFKYGSRTMLIIDSNINLKPLVNKLHVDILLISKNPHVNVSGLNAAIQPSIVVFDGSNSLWKIEQWKKECEQLLLPCFSVSEKGAYITDVSL